MPMEIYKIKRGKWGNIDLLRKRRDIFYEFQIYKFRYIHRLIKIFIIMFNLLLNMNFELLSLPSRLGGPTGIWRRIFLFLALLTSNLKASVFFFYKISASQASFFFRFIIFLQQSVDYNKKKSLDIIPFYIKLQISIFSP